MASSAAPDHIVVVVEENKSYSEIIGSSNAPYINSLAGQGELFTNYYGITHPSQPNYLALFSGSTQGVTDNNTYTFDAPTLAGELQQAGYTFGGYAEDGSPRKHNPWESFTDSQSTGHSFSQFPTDYSQLPTVSFVSPNQQNDMHDGTIAQGDQWLSANLGDYANWAKTHNSLLVVTFDEDDGTAGNHVATVVAGAGVTAGQEDGTRYNHYSLLHTIESLYGLPGLTSNDKNAPLMGFPTSSEPPPSTNTAPVAGADSFTMDQGTTLTVDAPGVLANDTDADGDSLTASVASGPSHGTLSLNSDGALTFTPDPLYSGSDAFTYLVSDGSTTATGTVDVTINPTDSTPSGDVIDGTRRADVLVSTAGDDTFTGGKGGDTFVLHLTFGHDHITDFRTGSNGYHDTVETDAFTSFDNLLAHAAQEGADTVISYDDGNTITLDNVQVSQLHDYDFRFV